MSQSLYWRPARVGRNQVGGSQLREIFQDYRSLTQSDSDFLRGLVAARVEGAEELLQALEKCGELDLMVE